MQTVRRLIFQDTIKGIYILSSLWWSTKRSISKFSKADNQSTKKLACVASVSVWFQSKQRGLRVKDRSKKFGSRFISRAVKTESVSFLGLSLLACYVGYKKKIFKKLPFF